ncbi:hypothetical protein OIU83_20250 [Flavobacterium sp. LS1R49]|uniref:Uncharacterized protein n=1 Tax=Flavobacterium shii TaxID=2987687 RepID=A0A9X2YWV3_9FLAO|nr:hypothetical protein [Flavobacterium shii]MCV9930003.1 hypothetical protein [Flavobacterium shii]
MRKTFTLFAILLFVVCNSQNTKTNRDSFKLELIADAKNNYTMQVPNSPYFVKEKVLQIYPSEKLYIETIIKDNSIYSMTVVNKNLNPKRTIEIDFSQNATDRTNKQMLLKVTNPFNKKLNYDASMYIIGHDKWISTSIIPILPNLVNYETWPDVIITLALENWRFE